MRIVIDLQSPQGTSKNRGMGRYTLCLAQAMARLAEGHELWIALNGLFPDTVDTLRAAFDGLVPPERVVVWEAPGPVTWIDPNDAWRREAAELIRESFIAGIRPDVVHVASLFEGFSDDCVTSVGRGFHTAPTVVTLYDLIPLIFEETSLPDPQRRAWYYQKLQWLKNADLWLAISEHTRRDAIERLGLPGDRVVNIGAGLDPKFRPVDVGPEEERLLRSRYGIDRPFVAYTGAIEYRKNVEGLIRAFARLPGGIREAYQLVIIYGLHEHDRRRLLALAEREGLGPRDVVFTGYVPDEDLVALYNLCALFAFPSLYEGFGLPPLEAMACGAPVISANTSSLPEVVGWEKALFDPTVPEAMAEKMCEALTDSDFREALRRHGLERAGGFSWEESARRALAAFEGLHGERADVKSHSVPVNLPVTKPRLAYVSPLPPVRSEIADYSRELLPDLARYYRIEVVVDQPEVSDPWLTANFPVRTAGWFEENGGLYDRILYHLGNSEHHRHMFNLIDRHPGVVVLHDFHLGGVLDRMGKTGYAAGILQKELYRSHGCSALVELAERGEAAAVRKYPCNLSVIEGADGVIVHSRQAIDLAERWYGSEAVQGWHLLPLIRQAAPPGDAGNSMRVAEQYRDAVERFAQDGPHASRRRLVQAVARIDSSRLPGDADLAATASAIAANRRDRADTRQMFLDVSNIAEIDAKTGIQRVTRAHLKNLLREPPDGWRVEPVRALAGSSYHHARAFLSRYLNLPSVGLPDEVVEIRRGDIFLGLDLTAHIVPDCVEFFTKACARGMQSYFVVHDLLPVYHPEWFSPGLKPVFTRWLETIARISDGIVCVSRAVADQLIEWMDNNVRLPRKGSLKIGYFHHGADFENARPIDDHDIDHRLLAALPADTPIFLMVGTVEPRKGHDQAIMAFEALWRSGIDVCLVIVGKEGWMVDALVERLRNHPEQGKRLFWLEGTSDATLLELYRRSSALLMPSRGEGFGLPLIEAARYGVPIVARDIPVFREVCGECAFYFTGERPEDLADAIRDWLGLCREGCAPSVEGMRCLTWEESTQMLLDVILGGRWYKTWEPG